MEVALFALSIAQVWWSVTALRGEMRVYFRGVMSGSGVLAAIGNSQLL